MLIERVYPYAGGLLLGGCALAFNSQVRAWIAAAGLEGSGLVSASFDIMITLTAFLFYVFVLAIAPGGGFLEKIFHTETFSVFRRYVIEALVVGSMAALACVPFTAAKATSTIWASPVAQSIWATLTVTALLAFFRVVHIFMLWVGIDARSRRRRRA